MKPLNRRIATAVVVSLLLPLPGIISTGIISTGIISTGIISSARADEAASKSPDMFRIEVMKAENLGGPVQPGVMKIMPEAASSADKMMEYIKVGMSRSGMTGDYNINLQSRIMLLQSFQNALLIEQNKRIIALLEAQAKPVAPTVPPAAPSGD